MGKNNYTNETNYCDFCHTEVTRNRLFLICAGIAPTLMDWKEIVCVDCEQTASRIEGYRMVSLSDLQPV